MQNQDRLEGVTAFVRVAESGSFTAAARAMGHSPSFMSKEVARLEDRLGVRLFNRTTRSVSLTDDGRSYLEHCRLILDTAEEAEQRLAEGLQTPRGLLKISVPVSIGLGFLRRHVPDFLAANPGVRLEAEFNDRFVDVVAEGFDLVIRVGQLKDSNLVQKRLAESPGVVVASPGYWAAHGKPEHPSELAGHQCIGFTLMPTPEQWEFNDPDDGVVSVTVPLRVRCNSAELEVSLVVAGTGVARVPKFVCAREIAEGQLEVVLEEFQRDPLGLYVVYPHRAHLSAKVRAFVDFLTARFAHDSWADATSA